MVGAAVHIVFLYAALIDVHFLWFVGVDTEGTGIGYLFFKGTCGQTVIQIAYCVTAITEVSVTVLVWGVGGEQIDQTTVFEGTDGVFTGIGVQVAYHQDVGIIVGFRDFFDELQSGFGFLHTAGIIGALAVTFIFVLLRNITA